MNSGGRQHSGQVPSLSCPLSFVGVLSRLQAQDKRPGWICSWISDQLISKSRQESFVGIAQNDCYYPSCNFPLQPEKKKEKKKKQVHGKGCSAPAALRWAAKVTWGQSDHGVNPREGTLRYWWKTLSHQMCGDLSSLPEWHIARTATQEQLTFVLFRVWLLSWIIFF